MRKASTWSHRDGGDVSVDDSQAVPRMLTIRKPNWTRRPDCENLSP
jgi:hypothetical protein